MAWFLLLLAGLFEVCWAIGLKYTDGFTRLWPTVGTVAAMIISLGLLGLGHGRLQGLYRLGHVGRLDDALRRLGFAQDGQDLAGVFGQKDQVTCRLGFEFVNHDGIVRRESPRMAPPAPWVCPRSKK